MKSINEIIIELESLAVLRIEQIKKNQDMELTPKEQTLFMNVNAPICKKELSKNDTQVRDQS